MHTTASESPSSLPFVPGFPLTRAIATDSRRIQSLDAGRGVAMLLVCLSHFGAVYFAPIMNGRAASLPVQIGMIASPMFMAVSGLMLGLMYELRRVEFAALRVKLTDRALFLLAVAHPLIALARVRLAGDVSNVFRMTFMTDAIAVAVLVGVPMLENLSARRRLLIAAAIFAGGWGMVYFWIPAHLISEIGKELISGALPDHVLTYSVPFAQWLAVYVAFTAVGQRMGRYYRTSDTAAVERLYLRIGLPAVAGAVAMRALGWLMRRSVYGVAFEPFASPWMKVPPSPTYLLLFGGVGMLLLYTLAVIQHRGRCVALLGWATLLGRCSLALFVLQFYIYYSLIGPLHLRYSPLWVVLFAASIIPLAGFARWWDSRALNRVLTVGLQHAVRIRDHGQLTG